MENSNACQVSLIVSVAILTPPWKCCLKTQLGQNKNKWAGNAYVIKWGICELPKIFCTTWDYDVWYIIGAQ
jgi:hypothetical protein